MKITVTKDRLLSALARSEKITGKNLSLPVLSCIHLTAQGQDLFVRSTNLDLGIEQKISIKSSQDGVVAVPGGLLVSYINQIQQDEDLTLSTQEGNLLIEDAKNKTVIKCLSHEDFPSIPRVEEAVDTFVISAREFVLGLKSVSYSASISSMKPELSSIFVFVEDGYMFFVATDSFRLAEKKLRVKDIDIEQGLLIPHRNIGEIVRVLETLSNEDITISFGKSQISFESRGVYLVSRVVEGAFPNYKQIIPKESACEVTILKQDLIAALKLSNVFSDKFNQIQIAIRPKTHEFVITSKDNDKGQNENSISCVIEGEEMAMNFNYRYIMDCLSSVQADSLVLRFAGQNKPLVIRGVSDPSFLYLVMPMNR